MACRPVRLAVILSVYGAVVILSLLTITIMYALMNERTAKESAMALVEATMSRNLRLVDNYFTALENTTQQTAKGLTRFQASGKNFGDTLNVSAYAMTWKLMTITPVDRAEVYNMFEMWRDNASAAWYTTGCLTRESECYFHSPTSNETSYVPTDFTQGTFDFSKMAVNAKPPPFHSRHEHFLQMNAARMPRNGLWSPMYISAATNESFHSRSFGMGRSLARTHDACDWDSIDRLLTFYYCVDFLGLATGASDPPTTTTTCLHVVATTIDAANLGDLQSFVALSGATTYALSVFVEDFTNHSCHLPEDVQTLFDAFVVDCGLPLPLPNGDEWRDRENASRATCTDDMGLIMGREDVLAAAAVERDTGIFVVFIDVTPRAFFFGALDRAKHASIAVSVSVCVIAVVVSVLFWLAIVVPIHWICQGLHRASTLASEPSSMVRKASRYTFIYEVDTLYKSYLELRKALTDLKSFVPQGLFFAPSTEQMYSDAMLMALFGPSSVDGHPESGDASGRGERKDLGKGISTTPFNSSSSSSSNVDDDDSPSSSTSSLSSSLTTSTTTVLENNFSPRSPQHSHVELSVVVEGDTPVGGGDKGPSAPANSHDNNAHYDNAAEHTRQEERPTNTGNNSSQSLHEGVPHRRRTHNSGSPNSKRTAALAAAAAAAAVGVTGAGAGAGGASSTTGQGVTENGTASMGGGIVQVLPASQTNEILAAADAQCRADSAAYTRDLLRDAGLLSGGAEEAARRKRDRAKYKRERRRVLDQAVSGGGGAAGKPHHTRKVENNSMLSHVRSGAVGATSPTATAKKKSTEQDSLLGGSQGCPNGHSMTGDSPSAASLELNLNYTRVNTFRHVRCSFVILSFSFRYIDTESLEETVTTLMDIVVKVVLRCGGVLEVFRPDLVAASFGAHSPMNRHAQFATLCGVTLMRKIPNKQRPLTRIVVDSGAFFVGNCGARGRTARIVFGDRFDFALDLMKYDIGLGRVICTDCIASILPSSFVIPVDYIVPLRNRVHGIQLFQMLNPARRLDPDYHDGANRFRAAYGAAVSGDLKRALTIIEQGQLFDAELGSYFHRALSYLLSQQPPRSRYCRFQLPLFELLGSEVKEQATKYSYEKLALEDINNGNHHHHHHHHHHGAKRGDGVAGGNDTLPSINFGFGDLSGSGAGGNSGDTMDPQVLSRAFFRHSANASVDLRSQKMGDSGHHLAGQGGRAGGGNALSSAIPANAAGGKDEEPPAAGSTAANAGGTGGDGSGGFLAFDAFEASESMTELPAVIVDHNGESWYRLPKPIGTGAFAEVYKALSASGTVMALKCIRLSSNNVQLADVVSEVNTACKLFSDHIVNYTGWAHVGGYLVIIMDYISGGSLSSALSAFPRGMPLQLTKRYASDALKGLAYLHRNGIVHADIKPQNILLCADGSCKLGDFGSSVTKANALSCGGDVFNLRGTAQYMSPEVAAGATPTLASDLWSFGITLFEMLTGKRPWMMRKLTVPPPTRRPSLPTSVFPAASGSAAGGSRSNSSSSSSSNVTAEVAPPALKNSDVGGPTGLKHTNAAASNGARTLQQQPASHADPCATPATYMKGSPLAANLGALPSPAQAVAAGGMVEELVEVKGLSDPRFVQGLANGTIVAHVDESDLPSREAYDLVSRCLREDPSARPCAAEIVDHVFFLL